MEKMRKKSKKFFHGRLRLRFSYKQKRIKLRAAIGTKKMELKELQKARVALFCYAALSKAKARKNSWNVGIC